MIIRNKSELVHRNLSNHVSPYHALSCELSSLSKHLSILIDTQKQDVEVQIGFVDNVIVYLSKDLCI